jgi:hypothetical protein
LVPPEVAANLGKASVYFLRQMKLVKQQMDLKRWIISEYILDFYLHLKISFFSLLLLPTLPGSALCCYI